MVAGPVETQVRDKNLPLWLDLKGAGMITVDRLRIGSVAVEGSPERDYYVVDEAGNPLPQFDPIRATPTVCG